MNNLLECYKLCKYFYEKNNVFKILKNVNFSIKYREMVAITGHSGSGKSTMLHILAGLDFPTSGVVFFKGQILHKLSDKKRAYIRNNELGFIYQFHHLLMDFSVIENISMPLLISGLKINQAKQISKKMLYYVGLKDKENYKPSELSGGERQRVAIARALVKIPKLILADEPTGNLDKNNAKNIIDLFNEFNENYGTAFIIVTHDLILAKSLNKILEMHNGFLK